MIDNLEKFDNISLSLEIKLKKFFLKNIDKSVSFPQLIIIRYLSISKEATVSDIAHFMNTSLSATTSLLNTMYKLDIIFRKRSEEDRRKVLISLTDKGENIYKQFKENKLLFFKSLSKYFSEEEIIVFHKFLKKLINVSEELIEKELTIK